MVQEENYLSLYKIEGKSILGKTKVLLKFKEEKKCQLIKK